MSVQWYYWHELGILGPYSGKELAALAANGDILPTDTVWKDDIEEGVQASRVQHLFRQAPDSSAPVSIDVAIGGGTAEPEEPEPLDPKVADKPAPRWDDAPQAKSGRARAVAGVGAVIVGQDGTTVRFRKKCTTCGHEDTSWKTIPIPRGTARVAFYCPKCRKTKHVEIQGYQS